MSNKQINVRPVGGNVLIKPQEQETVTASGIIIPASASKEKPQQGEIIALGTGKLNKDGKDADWKVKVGDIVVFRKYSPDEIEVDSQKYLIVKEEDILAVITK